MFPLNIPSNDDDRRQWQKQGGVAGCRNPEDAKGIQNRFYTKRLPHKKVRQSLKMQTLFSRLAV